MVLGFDPPHHVRQSDGDAFVEGESRPEPRLPIHRRLPVSTTTFFAGVPLTNPAT